MAAVDESLTARVSAVSALDEPNRRRLYDHVARQPDPVSRDDAAAALRMPRATVAFHLDRLVDEGLLEVSYQRRTGRTGPGAGRTAKLYRRSQRQVGVSLPERRYDLAARLLAAAFTEAERTGQAPRTALEQIAHDQGRELAAPATTENDSSDSHATVLTILEAHGFEPRAHDTDVVLVNCPFHTLAQEHTELVCGMNLHLLNGLLDALGHTGLSARLAPGPDHCCVRLTPDRPSPHPR